MIHDPKEPLKSNLGQILKTVELLAPKGAIFSPKSPQSSYPKVNKGTKKTFLDAFH